MIEILQFMFSGFWTFVGCWILLGMFLKALVAIVRAVRSK